MTELDDTAESLVAKIEAAGLTDAEWALLDSALIPVESADIDQAEVSGFYMHQLRDVHVTGHNISGSSAVRRQFGLRGFDPQPEPPRPPDATFGAS